MKETAMFHRMKPMFKEIKSYGFRVENSMEEGTPDSFWQCPCYSVWIELKQVNFKRPTDKIVPDWRPGQIPWAKKHKRYGGNWAMVITINNKFMFTLDPKRIYNIGELIPFTPKKLSEKLNRMV